MRVPWLACARLAAVLSALLGAASLLQLLSQHQPLDSASQSHPNHTLTPQQIQEAIREAESANAERLLRVQSVCQKYNLGLYRDTAAPPAFKQPPTPQYSVFYIDKAHRLSWCPVYKAASSSWLYNLCLLGGYDQDQLRESRKTQQLSALARRVYPELDYPEAEEALQSSLKLLVVRHPMERLLSAYRDKLENTRVRGEHGSLHFYRAYGARVVARYRQGGNATRTQTLLRPGSYYWPPGQPEPAGVEPTFQEFVRYLIDVDLLSYADDHWIPTYLYCTPCLLRYDIIAKVETLQRDQLYVLRAANIESLVRPEWRHRTTPAGATTSDVARRYYSQLSRAQVLKLYKKYQLDFELFGYDVTPYLGYASEK